MRIKKVTLVVRHPAGLHAKHASMVVRMAKRYLSEMFISNGKRTVNAKNIIGILRLGIKPGETIVVSAIGKDADEALSAIKRLVEDNFISDEIS
ncbi:MAG TPA: HPr family phosphocarrier protein [Anaerolineaceae bacterium]|nr:HPr family phosphocarrier protein [Anaerolineaceae bacterium]